MAQLTGTGAPTRKTLGALGDIYTDTNTGKQYECMFAYRDNTDGDFDCQWKDTGRKVELKSRKNPSGKIPEKQLENVAEEVKEEVEETPNRNRTNYAGYSRQKQTL